jgi:very-short-patch-repair endonuclease
MSRFSRTPKKTERARTLRRDMTKPEWVLWNEMRGAKLGVSFRRQHPIGPYYLDFYCPTLKLAIELDGSQHAQRTMQDAARTAFLNTRGIEVIRYWNSDVVESLGFVCADIAAALQRRRYALGLDPLPSSPLQGEE